jgi:hypothetical protein
MRLSSQNLNNRERDRNGDRERNEQVARHSHRFVFPLRPLVVIHVAFQVSASLKNRQPRYPNLIPGPRIKLAAKPLLFCSFVSNHKCGRLFRRKDGTNDVSFWIDHFQGTMRTFATTSGSLKVVSDTASFVSGVRSCWLETMTSSDTGPIVGKKPNDEGKLK